MGALIYEEAHCVTYFIIYTHLITLYSISLIFTREKCKIIKKCYRDVSYFTVMENANKMG